MNIYDNSNDDIMQRFDPEKQLKNLITKLTTSADDLLNKEFILYIGFANLEKK